MANSIIPHPDNNNNSRQQLPVVLKQTDPAYLDLSVYQPAEPRNQPPADSAELNVRELLGILRRRGLLIVMVTLFGGLLASAVAVLVPPDYTAKAQLIVEPEQGSPGADGRASASVVDDSAIDTQITLLAARDNLRDVLASLADDPAFVEGGSEQQSDAPAQAEPAINNLARIYAAIAGVGSKASQLVSNIRTMLDVNDGIPSFSKLERVLHVEQERRSRIISVRYTSNNPQQAATITNRVVEMYLKKQSGRKRNATQAQLTDLDQKIADLERTQAETENTIRQKLTGAQDTSGSQAASEVTIRQLERRVADNAEQYAKLVQRQRQLRDQSIVEGPSSRLLYTAAAPERPSSLDPKFFILPAMILSMIAAGVLAIIRDKFDQTLRSESQVQRAMGIPCVAMAPKLGWLTGRRPHEYLLTRPYSPYAEAIRAIVSSLQFGATPGQKTQVVQVCSSVRGEGKSALAASLAVYGTRLHDRVLLVDLDFRDPSLGKVLGLKPKSGVIDRMLFDKPLEEVVENIAGLGLDVLPMQACPVDPVTLFSTGSIDRLMEELRKNYDFIVVDGPPLLGVTESGLISSLADKVVYAVKWGSTRRDVAINAVNELRALGWTQQAITQRFRAIVTQVDLKRHARYQYGDAVELYARNRKYQYPNPSVRALSLPSRADEDVAHQKAAE